MPCPTVSSASIHLLEDRMPAALFCLLTLWEASVRATHHFLSEQDIIGLKPLVLEGLASIHTLAVLQDNDRQDAAPAGFMGVESGKIEMLFIHPNRRGTGLGKKLTRFAVEQLGATQVDVNEQNPQALGFYERMGFRVVARSPLDGQGKPFPLLHMTRFAA